MTCCVWCCADIETLGDFSLAARLHALDQINAANLQSNEGALTLCSVGVVTACAYADGTIRAREILTDIKRMNVLINAYLNTK